MAFPYLPFLRVSMELSTSTPTVRSAARTGGLEGEPTGLVGAINGRHALRMVINSIVTALYVEKTLQ